MAKIKTEELDVYKKSYNLVLNIYKVTNMFPKCEEYGVSSQMRRAAYSIPSNIIEGANRNSFKEYIKFLYISRGSNEELKFFTELSKDLKYMNEDEFQEIKSSIEEVGRLINGTIKKICELNNEKERENEKLKINTPLIKVN